MDSLRWAYKMLDVPRQQTRQPQVACLAEVLNLMLEAVAGEVQPAKAGGFVGILDAVDGGFLWWIARVAFTPSLHPIRWTWVMFRHEAGGGDEHSARTGRRNLVWLPDAACGCKFPYHRNDQLGRIMIVADGKGSTKSRVDLDASAPLPQSIRT